MSYEVEGIIVEIYPTKVFESGFQKREFVLNVSDNEDYPKYPKLEMTKDKVDFLDKYKVGDQVKLIRYGDANMTIKKSNPKNRKSFRARHRCDSATSKLTARYWSCKKW